MISNETSTKQIASVIALVCAIVMVVFQAIIAFGFPVGKAAWGGGSNDVSTGFRMASGIASVVYLFFVSVLLQVGGFRAVVYSETLCRRVTWFFVFVLFFGSALNWASPSAHERYLWGPFALLFALSCLELARSFQSSSVEAPKQDMTSNSNYWAEHEYLTENDQLI